MGHMPQDSHTQPQGDQTVPDIPFWCVFVDFRPGWLWRGLQRAPGWLLLRRSSTQSAVACRMAALAFCSIRTALAAVNNHSGSFTGIIGLMHCSCLHLACMHAGPFQPGTSAHQQCLQCPCHHPTGCRPLCGSCCGRSMPPTQQHSKSPAAKRRQVVEAAGQAGGERGVPPASSGEPTGACRSSCRKPARQLQLLELACPAQPQAFFWMLTLAAAAAAAGQECRTLLWQQQLPLQPAGAGGAHTCLHK
jgi:hypothetical protein